MCVWMFVLKKLFKLKKKKKKKIFIIFNIHIYEQLFLIILLIKASGSGFLLDNDDDVAILSILTIEFIKSSNNVT